MAARLEPSFSRQGEAHGISVIALKLDMFAIHFHCPRTNSEFFRDPGGTESGTDSAINRKPRPETSTWFHRIAKGRHSFLSQRLRLVSTLVIP